MSALGPLKIKLQLLSGAEIAFGPGKADLLEAIRSTGSISAASRAMGMSYRRAWLLVDEMNRCWSQALVSATPGGGLGRGARLTPAGESVLSAYRRLEEDVAVAAGSCPAMTTLAGGLRQDAPERYPATWDLRSDSAGSNAAPGYRTPAEPDGGQPL